MKTDYEKAIEWLNKKAEKAGGITNLGKTVGAPASTFFRVLKGGSPPGADKLLDWISQLGGKIVFPDEPTIPRTQVITRPTETTE